MSRSFFNLEMAPRSLVLLCSVYSASGLVRESVNAPLNLLPASVRYSTTLIQPTSAATPEVVELARTQAANLRSMLREGDEPDDLLRLEEMTRSADGVRGASTFEFGEQLFHLLSTMTLNYKPDGHALVPVGPRPEFFLPPTETMRKKMTYLYQYGLRLAAADLIDVETLKRAVISRLANPTRKTPQELDAWLDADVEPHDFPDDE